jgi:NADH-quinone oxidoreductase subunit J
MTALLFYILSALALLTTLLCLTRPNPVHALLYLMQALFAVALLYYLLGAPLLAAWQVILYAGAIMVLFLFVIMLLEPASAAKNAAAKRFRWIPPAMIGSLLLACGGILVGMDPLKSGEIAGFWLSPRGFGQALFEHFGLAVEIVSPILLFAAVGAFHLARRHSANREDAS